MVVLKKSIFPFVNLLFCVCLPISWAYLHAGPTSVHGLQLIRRLNLSDILNTASDTEAQFIQNIAQIFQRLDQNMACGTWAAIRLASTCKASTDKNSPYGDSGGQLEAIKALYAIRAAICENGKGNADVPMLCRDMVASPHPDDQRRAKYVSIDIAMVNSGKLPRCIEALRKVSSFWVSYSNSQQDAASICTASRHDADMRARLEDTEDMFNAFMNAARYFKDQQAHMASSLQDTQHQHQNLTDQMHETMALLFEKHYSLYSNVNLELHNIQQEVQKMFALVGNATNLALKQSHEASERAFVGWKEAQLSTARLFYNTIEKINLAVELPLANIADLADFINNATVSMGNLMTKADDVHNLSQVIRGLQYDNVDQARTVNRELQHTATLAKDLFHTLESFVDLVNETIGILKFLDFRSTHIAVFGCMMFSSLILMLHTQTRIYSVGLVLLYGLMHCVKQLISNVAIKSVGPSVMRMISQHISTYPGTTSFAAILAAAICFSRYLSARKLERRRHQVRQLYRKNFEAGLYARDVKWIKRGVPERRGPYSTPPGF